MAKEKLMKEIVLLLKVIPVIIIASMVVYFLNFIGVFTWINENILHSF